MKHLPFTILFLLLLLCPQREVFAYQHGYSVDSDDIWATVRSDLAVYEDPDGYDVKTVLPTYSGIRVTGSYGAWYEIEYEEDSVPESGYITKETYQAECLVYDGREKQILADGVYALTFCGGQTSLSPQMCESDQRFAVNETSFSLKFLYAGDGYYRILRTDSGRYLKGDSLFADDSAALWGDIESAGLFKVVHKKAYYGIKDASTSRFLSLDEAGVLSFQGRRNIFWRARRNKKAIGAGNLRDFVQFDAEWGADHYGAEDSDDLSNTFCTSGCGIFATMNAIYSLTGHYIDPHLLADYAVEKYFRIEGYGTDIGFFKAAARHFGYEYGFAYDGSGESMDQLKEKLKKGDTAIVYVPGHYVTIVDYNEKKDKFLLLDPHYLPKRGTSSFGDWVSGKDLEEGNLMTQWYFYYRACD